MTDRTQTFSEWMTDGAVMNELLCHQLDKERAAYNENNDCAVRALALAFERPYSDVHAFLATRGRRPRGGTSWEAIAAAIFHFSGGRVRGGLFCGEWQRTGRRSVTVATFELASPKGVDLVHTARHILCVRDYKALDYTSGRRHRVKAFLRIR